MAKNRQDLTTQLKRLGENHAADPSNSNELQESSSERSEDLSDSIRAPSALGRAGG